MKVLLLSLFCLLLAGCGTSSPRFGNGDTSKKSGQHEKKKSGPRFSSKHIDEERKEDDRKVDVRQVAVRFSSSRPAPPPSSTKSSETKPEQMDTGIPGKINDQKMMDVILGYLGTPYQYGGETRSGIDCSAFTSAVYGQAINMKLPRTTSDQVKLGTLITREGLKFGDLMFFNTTGSNPSHVGIYIGDDLFAHASEAFGVTITSIESSYYKTRYTESRRIIE